MGVSAGVAVGTGVGVGVGTGVGVGSVTLIVTWADPLWVSLVVIVQLPLCLAVTVYCMEGPLPETGLTATMASQLEASCMNAPG
ncbi:MAG: hypothetical protein DLM53_08690 [Candidatus Eremiobacter antarcticus]|nr:MAG: hypothetical protein DLM53_08690 [Candidatus Eremiobacter sp. RRmetagenome_bin22]